MMNPFPWIILGLLACLSAAPEATAIAPAAPPLVLEQSVLEPVWAGHPVGFALLTHAPHQFAAYYDAERRLTVASRRLDQPGSGWIRQKLGSTLGWDSHNSIVMALDGQGYLHVSGNMHVQPLVYFRSDQPFDVASLQRVPAMTGEAEQRVTYPKFLREDAGRLIFMYRDGSSGLGRRLLNVYDESTRVWRRWLDQPLLDGRARDMNAYPTEIQKGPDGWFHLVWMWRDTPDCRSNHDISHARSRNLKDWESMDGHSLALPITPDTPHLVVDPVPSENGLINMGFGLGFDAARRPLVHYHKYDAHGHSQIYAARWESSAWRIRAVSNWSYRWEFGGGGSVPCLVAGGDIHLSADGRLVQTWRHPRHGSGAWELDPLTLKPKGPVRLPSPYPPDLERPSGDFPGLQVHWEKDGGSSPDPATSYVLRWETLPPHRDRPRSGPLPDPSPLTLYRIEHSAARDSTP